MMVGTRGSGSGRLLLEILLNGGVILLSAGEITGLEILGKLAEGGRKSGRGCGCGSARRVGLQSGEIGLGLGEFAGLKVLAKLLEFVLEILEVGLELLIGKGVAAGDAGNRHESSCVVFLCGLNANGPRAPNGGITA